MLVAAVTVLPARELKGKCKVFSSQMPFSGESTTTIVASVNTYFSNASEMTQRATPILVGAAGLIPWDATAQGEVNFGALTSVQGPPYLSQNELKKK